MMLMFGIRLGGMMCKENAASQEKRLASLRRLPEAVVVRAE